MTLIIALPTQDGIIFGSDSQVTSGEIRSTATKIFVLNNHVLWGASGELALIQRVAEQLESFPSRNEPLAGIRDSLGLFVKNAVEALLRLDFRTAFAVQNPDLLLQLHPGDFLFVEHHDKPRILHVLVNGTCEWIDGRFAATGNGASFAHALLQKYAGAVLARDHAKLLAYKVIEEAIQVGAYGLGPPIDIWEVCSGGVKQAKEEEIIALADTAHLLRDREVQMLTGPLPAASVARDTLGDPGSEKVAR